MSGQTGLARPLNGVSLLWLGLAVAALLILAHFDNEPGRAAQPPATWPASTSLTLSPRHPTLLVFMHPHCPCSRATLGELTRIQGLCLDRLHIMVLISLAPGFEPDAGQSLILRARQIPGVETSLDVNLREAGIFRSFVSGQAILYDCAGRLVFSGGLTPSRGHEGDNLGSETVLNFVLHGQIKNSSSRVYGCPLDNPAEKFCQADSP